MSAFDTVTIVMFSGILFAFGCVYFMVRSSLASSRGTIQYRAQTVCRRLQGARDAQNGAVPDVSARRTDMSQTPLLDRLARRLLPRQAILKSRLARTGRNISVGGYVAISLILMGATALISLKLANLPVFLAVLLSVALGFGLPHVAVSQMATRRTKAFNDIFPDAIDLIVRGLRSGLPVTESLASVGQEMADPVGHEFRLITDAIKFGTTLDEALWSAANRLEIQEFKFFVISLSVQKETGGNLAETLANLSDILRRRHQMKLKVKAMSSEARASAMILSSLPFLLFGIIFLLNNDYAMDLFTDPRGRMMLVAVSLLMGTGIMVMRKMVRFEI